MLGIHGARDKALWGENFSLVSHDQPRALIAVPKDLQGLARGIGEAHKRYSRMRNFDEGVLGYLFQGRFGSCVLEEKHLVAAVRYVERNPVRAGIVNVAWEYPWSSVGYHAGEQEKMHW